MANELLIASSPSVTIYGVIINADGHWWNGSAFESYLAANYANYVIPLSEQGSSGIYDGDFPASLTTAGVYQIIYFRQEGGSPAEGDTIVGTGSINWIGSRAITSTVYGSMTGQEFRDYVLQDFKRTDKDAALYDAVRDTIKDMKRRFEWDEIKTEKDTTDTISTLGDYQIADESDFGLMIGDVIVRDGNNSYPLNPLSKEAFDRAYPNPTASAALRGRPQDWCRFGRQIYIGPVPDRTSYTYHISYTIDDNAGIDSTTAAVPFTTTYREVLKFGTLARLYAIMKNDVQAQKYGRFYESNMAEAIRRENKNAVALDCNAYHGV